MQEKKSGISLAIAAHVLIHFETSRFVTPAPVQQSPNGAGNYTADIRFFP
jgi:hypothetical protein